MLCYNQTFLRQKVTLASSVPTKVKSDSVHEFHTLSECENTKCRQTYRETGQYCLKSGVLRYALHLKFVCPSRKKSSKLGRKKSLDDEERRFYLYNDLRVVFPQRHTDSDEGKVCLEKTHLVISFFPFREISTRKQTLILLL